MRIDVTVIGRSFSTIVASLALLLYSPLRLAADTDTDGSSTASGEKPDTPREANRLADEKSPYLLQHAHNPVDWYPWGDEAFRRARTEDKPIFLSIGYSTCHWCHVMERESFEDEEIASYLNEHFVSIKVDREERPDVDEVYMRALLAMRGSGGWPLSAFLLPDGRPFFLGTYFPPRDHPQRGVGFKTVLERAVELWSDRRAEIEEFAKEFTEGLQQSAGPQPAELGWTPELCGEVFKALEFKFDAEYGGFAGPPAHRPKFPSPSNMDFLLAFHHRTGRAKALSMVRTTLDHMHAGGIHDHLGHGFARYSTDRQWHVPHFEKMLYDNALLACTYLDAFRVTGASQYRRVALETLGYLLDRMSREGGGFYSAEDADSEGEEGKYYVFSLAEVIDALGEADGELFADRYGIVEGGNFEDTGKSVLHVAISVEELAARVDQTPERVRERLEAARKKLLAVRQKRVPPRKDDKILADWNGLALSALSRAYEVSGEAKHLEAARHTAEFIEAELSEGDRLLHRFRDGEARYPGYLEDYAFVGRGLLDLYEASLDLRYLERSASLARSMLEQFWDEERGAFFQTGPAHEKLVIRTRDFHDGAAPAGNSVATNLLQRLAFYTSAEEFSERVAVMSRYARSLVDRSPDSCPQLMLSAERSFVPRVDIVLVGRAGSSELEQLRRRAQRVYLPARTIVRLDDSRREAVARQVPWIAKLDDLPSGDTATVLVRRGENGAWRRTSDAAELESLLRASD